MYRIEIDYRKSGSALIPGLKTGVFTLRPLRPREIKTIFLTKTLNYFTTIIKPYPFFDTGLSKPKVYIVIEALQAKTNHVS